MKQGGIFSAPSALGISSDDAPAGVQDFINSCTQNLINLQGMTAEQARQSCSTSAGNYVKCGTECQSLREGSPEWANCVQKCHGWPPVDYSPEKKVCADQGLVFDWMNGGCSDPAKYNGCPTGYKYVRYQDGTERCVPQTDYTDPNVLAGKCPAGSTLQTVPGGSTCVSNTQPTPKKPPAKQPVGTKKPPVVDVTTGDRFVPQPQAKGNSLFSNPLVILGIGAAVVGGIILAKKKAKKDGKHPVKANRRRRRY